MGRSTVFTSEKVFRRAVKETVRAALVGLPDDGTDTAALRGLMLQVLENQRKILMNLDNLITQVKDESTVVDSVVVMLDGLKKQLADAGQDPRKLQELSDAISANKAKLAAAVIVDTPVPATGPTADVITAPAAADEANAAASVDPNAPAPGGPVDPAATVPATG